MTDLVTGALGYTGQAIARDLLERGRDVRTLVNDPVSARRRVPALAARLEAVLPYAWHDEDALTESLDGVETLYNTYWIRFPHAGRTHDDAVANSSTLFAAAGRAGVSRIVHVSVAHAAADSPFPYQRGKAAVERALRACGTPHVILRPTVLFGDGDVLVNNIAWLLRTLPVFAVAGDGRDLIRPVHVRDLACAAVDSVARDGEVVDVAGPETFQFVELVRTIRKAVRSRARIVRVPPSVAVAMSRAIGMVVRDVLLTRDELDGLRAGLCSVAGPALGGTTFTGWLSAHAGEVGVRYAHELRRRPYARRVRFPIPQGGTR